MPVIRTTASLYNEPHRVTEHAQLIWAVIADFDYDRGELNNISRDAQEAMLYRNVSKLLPTFAVKTRAGFHLYWMLKEPVPTFSYSYTASLIRDFIQADPSTIVFAHCMSLFSKRTAKPAIIVDSLEFPCLGGNLELFKDDFRLYTVEDIQKCIAPKSNISTSFINNIAEYNSNKPKFSMNADIKFKIDNILEGMDILNFIRVRGLRAYYRGQDKIIMSCPYHMDRHPSAFLNIDPASPYYGFFHCVSCGKKRSLINFVKDLESGVLS